MFPFYACRLHACLPVVGRFIVVNETSAATIRCQPLREVRLYDDLSAAGLGYLFGDVDHATVKVDMLPPELTALLSGDRLVVGYLIGTQTAEKDERKIRHEPFAGGGEKLRGFCWREYLRRFSFNLYEGQAIGGGVLVFRQPFLGLCVCEQGPDVF